MKHETRPTPETDEEERIDNGDTHPILEFARKLERERDELHEALDTLTLVVGLTPIAGNKEALQEAMDLARATLKKIKP